VSVGTNALTFDPFLVIRGDHFRTRDRDEAVVKCRDLERAVGECVRESDFISVNKVISFSSVAVFREDFLLYDEYDVCRNGILTFITFVRKRDLRSFLPSWLHIDYELFRIK